MILERWNIRQAIACSAIALAAILATSYQLLPERGDPNLPFSVLLDSDWAKSRVCAISRGGGFLMPDRLTRQAIRVEGYARFETIVRGNQSRDPCAFTGAGQSARNEDKLEHGAGADGRS